MVNGVFNILPSTLLPLHYTFTQLIYSLSAHSRDPKQTLLHTIKPNKVSSKDWIRGSTAVLKHDCLIGWQSYTLYIEPRSYIF